MRLILGRIGALFATILFWVWFIVDQIFDWIGRSTVVDDLHQLIEHLPDWFAWLLSTPWQVPAILATCLTIFLILLSLPRRVDSEFEATGDAQLVNAKRLMGKYHLEKAPLRYYIDISDGKGFYR